MPLPGDQWSKGQYGAYDRPAQGRLPAAVCILPESGQFPVTVLSVVRQYAPCGVTRRSSRQIEHEVGVLSHHPLLCTVIPVVQSAVVEYSPPACPRGHRDA